MADTEPLHKGHTRSVSAGGELALSTFVPKSALRSRGHLRALSQGQIDAEDSTSSSHARGHARAPSKTDFILPPGHRETGEVGGGGKAGSSGGGAVGASSANNIVKGHSRQASNTESIYTLRNKPPPSKFRTFLSFLLFRNKKKSEAAAASYTRTVVPNHLVPAPHKPNGGTNEIRTTKYTVYNFLFKNLFEQFHRAANVFFIFIVLLNWVPAINAFGKEIAMIPVLFVLGVTAVKDLCEDRQRNASDKRINSSTCRVYNGEEERYKKVMWKELRTGDIVHLSNDEVVPADILLLCTSDHADGVCYLDTCNLDGESNLKERNVPKSLVKKQRGFRPSDFRSYVEVDRPTTKLYEFRGAIIDVKDGRIPVSTEHLILRDSVIKNTDFVEGIVVYTGHETKAMLNNSGPRHKCSSLEESMNRDIVWCVAMLLILCTMGSVGTVFWLETYHFPLNVPFLDITSASYEAFLNFWVFIIILQTFIPLSLYVTIELSKLLQVFHIHHSLDLYDAETNRRTECRALNITEQLGQIQYIFSDKTGTLTENKMLFKRCCIGGIDYDHPTAKAVKGEALSIELDPNKRLLEDIESDSPQSKKITEFLIALALCNTVVVAAHPHVDIMNASGVIEGEKSPSLEKKYLEDPASVSYQRLIESRTPTPPPQSDDLNSVPIVYPSGRPKRLALADKSMPAMSPICSSTESSPTAQAKSSPLRPKLLNVPNMFFNKRTPISSRSSPKSSSTLSAKPIFEAESPDELALVQMAYIYNYRLVKRTPHKAVISLPGENILEFDILRVLKFDPERKCMSVVVRRPVTKEIVVYTKGADSTIFPRLVDPCSESATETQINRYSQDGLRVLAVASRVISEDSWVKIEAMLDSAVQAADKKQAYSEVESELHLMGATGIEDRLQPNVKDTLEALKAAGIVVWVLTGDKIETAQNIALSSGLFTNRTEVLKLNANSKHAAECAIEVYKATFERTESRPQSTSSRQAPLDVSQKGLVVDGETLTYILCPGSRLTKPFLELAEMCSGVLCCRVTPLQKAYLVKVVKEKLRKRTLAVGDGANDVSMIQAADVGVGISGQEGMQAVMASDFAIARFRVLCPLLLIHGHWTYHRLASMVSYFFYKNAAFVFLIFWFQFFCGFSGTVMIDQMYLMLFNLFFTSLTPIAIGVYDKDASEKLLMSQPSLYRYGRLGKGYQPFHFWLTLLNCVYQSLVIFYIAAAVYSDTDMGIWEFGTVISTSCIFAMSGEAMLEAKYWTVLHLASVAISLGSFFIFFVFYNEVCMQCIGLTSNTWVMRTTVGDYRFYFVVLLSTVVALLPRFTLNCWDNLIKPSEITRAVVVTKNAKDAGGNFLVSWSRSTSSSSIFRSHDGVAKITPQVNSLTSVG